MKKLILTHHDPTHTDDIVRSIEKACRTKFPETDASREGMVIELL